MKAITRSFSSLTRASQGVSGGESIRSAAGYAMIIMMIAVSVLAIGLLAVAPRVAQQARREREEELIFRGQQYARAIYLFQQHFNRYPNSVKELLHTNNMSFLRKAWPDPMTPGGKWRFIHVTGAGALVDSWTVGQQNRLPFSSNPSSSSTSPAGSLNFGSLGGSASSQPAATSSSGGFNWPPGGTTTSTANSSSSFGSGFSLSSSTEPSPSSTTGSASPATPSQASSGAPGRPLDKNGKPKQSPDCAGTGTRPVPGLSSSWSSSSSSSTSSSFGFGSGAQGLAIAGVASCSDQLGLRTWNKKKHYDEWEFLGVGFNPGAISVLGGSSPGPTQTPTGQGGQQGSQPGNLFPAGQPPEPPTPDQDMAGPDQTSNPQQPPDTNANPPAAPQPGSSPPL